MDATSCACHLVPRSEQTRTRTFCFASLTIASVSWVTAVLPKPYCVANCCARSAGTAPAWTSSGTLPCAPPRFTSREKSNLCVSSLLPDAEAAVEGADSPTAAAAAAAASTAGLLGTATGTGAPELASRSSVALLTIACASLKSSVGRK